AYQPPQGELSLQGIVVRLTATCQLRNLRTEQPAYASAELRSRADRSSRPQMRLRFAVQSAELPEARDSDRRKGRRSWASRSPNRTVRAALRNRHRARAE